MAGNVAYVVPYIMFEFDARKYILENTSYSFNITVYITMIWTYSNIYNDNMDIE